MSDARPNVLWLMTDEQRTDSLGFCGSPWARTPNLDRLAAEGVVFETALTPAPVCIPARLSMLTGRYPHETRIWWNRPPAADPPHLTDRFVRAGYRTASFGKQHYCTTSRAFQTERQLVLSDAVAYFDYAARYDPADFNVVKYPGQKRRWIFAGRFPAPAERTTEARAVDAALDWLDEGPAGRPFLLRVSFNAPHTPVAPPPPFDELIDPDEIALPPAAEAPLAGRPAWIARDLASMAGSSVLTGDQIRRMRQAYYGQAAFVDQQFGRLLEAMRSRGLLDNTIVAYVSDHGTHLGDYGLVQKQTFYEPVVCVPYFFWCPRQLAAGVKLRTPVETISLLPTLLELAGLAGGDEALPASLAGPLRAGREPAARCVFSEVSIGSFGLRDRDRMVLVRDGDWKLSVCLDPQPCEGMLCHLGDDPLELVNLYDRPEHAGVRERLLREIIAFAGQERPLGIDE